MNVELQPRFRFSLARLLFGIASVAVLLAGVRVLSPAWMIVLAQAVGVLWITLAAGPRR